MGNTGLDITIKKITDIDINIVEDNSEFYITDTISIRLTTTYSVSSWILDEHVINNSTSGVTLSHDKKSLDIALNNVGLNTSIAKHRLTIICKKDGEPFSKYINFKIKE